MVAGPSIETEMIMSRKVPTSFHVSPGIRKQLQGLSAVLGIPQQEIVEEALSVHLAKVARAARAGVREAKAPRTSRARKVAGLLPAPGADQVSMACEAAERMAGADPSTHINGGFREGDELLLARNR